MDRWLFSLSRHKSQSPHPEQLVHKFIDRPLRHLNLPGQHPPLLFKPRILQFFVQVQHPGDECIHAIMMGDIGGVVGVDGAD